MDMQDTTAIRLRPTNIPGMMPPINMAPMEVLTVAPYTTITMDGGIIGPMTDEEAVTATEKSGSYPSSTMAGISMPPMEEVSATAEPVIPPKTYWPVY